MPTLRSLLATANATSRALAGIGDFPALDHAGLRGAIELAAGAIRSRGILPSDRIALVMRNRPERRSSFKAS